ncbi:hypothetical protein [Streptomyces sp. NPDC059168]|uniref:hypothetical protein n=1 Tax=Streptomyces sp. NPDC059168 TaxID=3346753 RepID=UPI0036C226AC
MQRSARSIRTLAVGLLALICGFGTAATASTAVGPNPGEASAPSITTVADVSADNTWGP